jgi:hypothetical protein
MATIEDAIYSLLSGSATVAALVGTRIYRVKMPDNPQMPAITYQTVYSEPIESFSGFSGLWQPIMRVDCWGKTAGSTQDLAEKVRLALHGYQGSYQDRRIHNILEWSTTELYDEDADIFHVACSMRIWYT